MFELLVNIGAGLRRNRRLDGESGAAAFITRVEDAEEEIGRIASEGPMADLPIARRVSPRTTRVKRSLRRAQGAPYFNCSIR